MVLDFEPKTTSKQSKWAKLLARPVVEVVENYELCGKGGPHHTSCKRCSQEEAGGNDGGADEHVEEGKVDDPLQPTQGQKRPMSWPLGSRDMPSEEQILYYFQPTLSKQLFHSALEFLSLPAWQRCK